MSNVLPAPGTPLALGAALNFRELGGYPAAGGRTVRRGLLWRSGQLIELTAPAARAQVAALGLRYILDLRSAGEAAAYPDWIPGGARYENISAMRYTDGSEVDFSPAGFQRLNAVTADEAGRRGVPFNELERLAALYRWMPFGNPAFRALFAALEAGEAPLLFHCAAGKDRTGIAAALILLALGADRETALWDYAQTNVCRKPAIDAYLAAHAAEYAAAGPAKRQYMQAVEGVAPALAEGALHAIEERYDSYEAFFAAEYGLDAARLAALRERYLA